MPIGVHDHTSNGRKTAQLAEGQRGGGLVARQCVRFCVTLCLRSASSKLRWSVDLMPIQLLFGAAAAAAAGGLGLRWKLPKKTPARNFQPTHTARRESKTPLTKRNF